MFQDVGAMGACYNPDKNGFNEKRINLQYVRKATEQLSKFLVLLPKSEYLFTRNQTGVSYLRDLQVANLTVQEKTRDIV